MIRYYSCYLWHTHDEYSQYENEYDRMMKPHVKLFNKYDLYSKSDNESCILTSDLKEYYTDLVKEYISTDLIINY